MKISEEFISIQGEGPSTGKPSYFLRLFGCNQDCYFCDSKFSHDKENSFYEIPVLLLSKKIQSTMTEKKLKNLVITGGEPTLQWQELSILLNTIDIDCSIEIETNGTIDTTGYNQVRRNISPKNSNFFVYRPNYIVKFVYDRDNENWIKDMCQKNLLLEEKVYIMPIGKNVDEMLQNSENAVNFCLKTGYNYCHRVHVSIWNGKKGV